MSISCYCGDYDDSDEFDNSDWFYELYKGDDFSPLSTKRGRRCCSCKALIKVGSDAIRIPRWRYSIDDIEERIHGDDVPLAPFWICEVCGGLALALLERGFCFSIQEDIKKQIAEYNDAAGIQTIS